MTQKQEKRFQELAIEFNSMLANNKGALLSTKKLRDELKKLNLPYKYSEQMPKILADAGIFEVINEGSSKIYSVKVDNTGNVIPVHYKKLHTIVSKFTAQNRKYVKKQPQEEETPILDEQNAIEFLKEKGYKIAKPVKWEATSWEEI